MNLSRVFGDYKLARIETEDFSLRLSNAYTHKGERVEDGAHPQDNILINTGYTLAKARIINTRSPFYFTLGAGLMSTNFSYNSQKSKDYIDFHIEATTVTPSSFFEVGAGLVIFGEKKPQALFGKKRFELELATNVHAVVGERHIRPIRLDMDAGGIHVDAMPIIQNYVDIHHASYQLVMVQSGFKAAYKLPLGFKPYGRLDHVYTDARAHLHLTDETKQMFASANKDPKKFSSPSIQQHGGSYAVGLEVDFTNFAKGVAHYISDSRSFDDFFSFGAFHLKGAGEIGDFAVSGSNGRSYTHLSHFSFIFAVERIL
jgi:hypothetical protein